MTLPCVCVILNVGAVAIPRSFFGRGVGRIHLDDVNCQRSEVTLTNCSHNGVGNHNCGHAEDAGVICLGRWHTSNQAHPIYMYTRERSSQTHVCMYFNVKIFFSNDDLR